MLQTLSLKLCFKFLSISARFLVILILYYQTLFIQQNGKEAMHERGFVISDPLFVNPNPTITTQYESIDLEHCNKRGSVVNPLLC